MNGKPAEINSAARRLREIMLGYLQAGGRVANWPGADALTIDDVVDSYAEAVARGEVPDWQGLLSWHPELDAELHAWLAAKDRWKFVYRPDPPGQPRRADQNNAEAQRAERNTEAV